MTTTVTIHTADRAATVKVTEKRDGRDATRKETVGPNSVGTFHATELLSLSVEEDAPAADEGDAA